MSPLVLSLVLVCVVFAGTVDTEIAKLCELDGGYDINTLRKPPYWEVAISNTSQCPGFIKNREHNCTVYFSFCQTLPKNNTLPAGSCSNPPSMDVTPSVCMVIDNQTDDPRIMGQYNKTVDPFYKLKATDGRSAFAADFPHGDGFNCTETITTMEFRCYPEADWDTAVGNNVTKFVISAGFPPDEDCEFLMVMKYKGACVAIPSPPFHLAIGVGWILIIIAVCLVLLYIIVGTVVNAVRGKRRPKDLFPNYRFWKGFPQLLLDGLHFSLDLVTCHLCRNRSATPKYEAI